MVDGVRRASPARKRMSYTMVEFTHHNMIANSLLVVLCSLLYNSGDAALLFTETAIKQLGLPARTKEIMKMDNQFFRIQRYMIS